VRTTFGDFVSSRVAVPVFVDTADINNNSPSQIEHIVHYGEKETREFTWSITAGVTVGATVTEKVGLPGVGTELSMSMQFSVSATQGQAYREEKDWSQTITITVPSFSTVHCQAALARIVGTLPFVVEVVKDGRARCQVAVRYYGPRTRTFEVPLDKLLGADERRFEARGMISGAFGIGCQIDAKGRKLEAAELDSLAPGVSTVPASLGTLRL